MCDWEGSPITRTRPSEAEDIDWSVVQRMSPMQAWADSYTLPRDV